MIILLSFLSLIAALAIENKMIALTLMTVCILTAVVILYRHLGDLTDIVENNPKMKALKGVTIFNCVILIFCVASAVSIGTGLWKISENKEKYLAATVIAAVILFSGNIAPKLPFNRHTGLRFPWTVTDEDTWIVAHRILGYVSIPLAVVYIAGVFAAEHFELLTSMVIVLWVGMPGGLSYAYYYKKMHGKL